VAKNITNRGELLLASWLADWLADWLTDWPTLRATYRRHLAKKSRWRKKIQV